MGVFEAVKRGHTKPEDRLVAAVFGTLEIIDRSKFLARILEKCRIEFSGQTDLNSLRFHYWLPTGRRTPDVVLREKSSNRIRISIECKLGSDFDVDQLVEEYEDRLDCLVAVSDHWSEPPEIKQARDRLKKPRLHWISWREIYALLHQNKATGNATEQKLVDDLLLLMESKGLMMFDGFNKKQLKAAGDLAGQWEGLCEFSQQCDALFEDVKARLSNEDIICSSYAIQLGHTKGIRDGISNWTGIEAWDHSWITQHKGSEKARIGSSAQKLTAQLHLDFQNPKRPLEFIVGYDLLLLGKKGNLLREKFVEKAKKPKVANEIRKSPYLVMFWHSDESDWIRDSEVQARDLNDKWPSLQTFNDAEAVTFGYTFGQESLTSKGLTGEIAKYMVGLRDFVTKNELHVAGDYD